MWTLLNFIGIGLPKILDQISEWREKKINAQTEYERIKADEHLGILERKKEVVQEAQRYLLGRIVRTLWALPFILFTWKIVVWDKVLGWGVTADLSQNFWIMLWTILGGYFIVELKRK